MWKCHKYKFGIMSAFLCVALVFYGYRADFGHQNIRIQDLPLARDTITALDVETLIISPYYEPRLGRSVRVIAIVHVSVKDVFCTFHCSTNQNVSVRAKINLHRDRFGFPYGTADLLCEEPSRCDYTYMSFSSKHSTNYSQSLLFEVRNRPPPPVSSNFTVCISTLYGNFNNALQLVQSIEMYKILGVSKVTIYNTSVSPDVDKVLRYYIDEGTLEVVSWPIDRYLLTSKKWNYTDGLTTEIGYYGQTATLNDCLYRNMYSSKYVLIKDIDEIIIPLEDRDWPSLMESLEKEFPNTTVFRFESRVFQKLGNSSDFNLWPQVPGVNVLQHIFREPPNTKVNNPRKTIVNPRKVFQTSIHYSLKFEGIATEVANSSAILFHCKEILRKGITEEDLIQDEMLWRYNSLLVPNVNPVIEKLFPRQ